MIFDNILIYFVVIPLIMLGGLALCRNIKQIRAVAVTGSLALLALSVVLLVQYLEIRAGGNEDPMLFVDSWTWFAPLNINLAVGVDGNRSRRLVRIVDNSPAQGILPVADTAFDRCVRILHLD